MARSHRRSKALVVQVNPNATMNYVVGILTGARDYVDGLLRGSGKYNAWVETEMSLEGSKLPRYVPDRLEAFLSNPENRNLVQKLLSGKPLTDQEVDYIIKNTNYGRTASVDVYMQEASRRYRSMLGNLLKTENKSIGIAYLNNFNSVENQYEIPDVVKSKVKVL